MSLFPSTILLAALSTASASTPATQLAPVTVTGTREKALVAETPSSVGTIAPGTIREIAPLHPGQILGQIPGVAVAVTNGEGHTTAIRQPFTTAPVYLFLEDGVPIRATGFFNHNALYEVNLPMAGGIEVIRGPGTSLYGSDAIGGIVNILSAAPIASPNLALSAEGGAFGTRRLLAGGGSGVGERGAARADVNTTHTDGWRDQTGYNRFSGNLRYDQPLGPAATLKTIVAYSRIDQQTGANSPLTFVDYLNDPTRNHLPIAYREVQAVRASLEYEYQHDATMLSLLPYFRDNAMELNGSYNLNSDPRIEHSHNVSYGLLAKARRNFAFLRARLIGGLDLDYSPGSREEDNLLVTRTGSGANTTFTAFARGTRIYDYDVTFKSASPYVHTEFSPTTQLRITAGLRYDRLSYAMTNHLPAGTVAASVLGATRFYGQATDAESTFTRFSPKLGFTHALGAHAHLFASYHHGFRAPSESQLYRGGNDSSAAGALARAELARELRPIKARQVEAGLRGDLAGWSYELVAYQLEKRDDLVGQRDLATNVVTSVNAGRTRHRGVEVGLGAPLGRGLRLDAAFSYARHRYVDWQTASANLSGREMEAAPRLLLDTRLTWRPAAAFMTQLEWVRLGSYWLEAGNSPTFGKYPGHDLLHVRASYALTNRVTLIGRVLNALDKRFADSASVTSNTPVFSPGLPRAFYAGVELKW